MTATATSTSTTNTTLQEWTRIFPRQATETYTSSATFMRQLTVVAVSTITYLKNVFPEDNYKLENFGGIKIRILKKVCNDELAQFLSTAIGQAFEAFEKRYLRQLAICFYEGDCKLDNLIEYHIFEYSYKPDGMFMSINFKGSDNVKSSVNFTLDNVAEKTLQLIRACVVVINKEQPQLPDKLDVSVRLYYNEDAPEGYQAPGFIAGPTTEDPLGYTYGELLKLGRVETPFHKLELRSYNKDTAASNEPIPSENLPVMTQVPEELTGQGSVTECCPHMCCECNNYESDAYNALLVFMQQHATCYGVLAERAAATRHCCVTCSDEDTTRKPTDAKLASVVANKRQCFAIVRRALELCWGRDDVSTSLLCDKLGLSQLSAVKLMKLLHNKGIIERHSQSGLATSSKIDPIQLKFVTNQLFQTETGEESLVDRLVAETFACSQSSQSNPVEEILSPLEKVCLQKTSQLGRVIENPKVVETPDDPTLKQYREAIVLLEKDENIEMGIALVNDMDKLRKRGAKRSKELGTGVRTKKARLAKK